MTAPLRGPGFDKLREHLRQHKGQYHLLHFDGHGAYGPPVTAPGGINPHLLQGAAGRLIFETAASLPAVGPITETLKWGEPAYLTTASKSGSTIRIDAIRGNDTGYAAYFICHTNLVDRFRELYRGKLQFEGNRAIVLDVKKPLPISELSHCLAMALTYQLEKQRKR